jgi:hypothetical protein
MLNQCPSWAAGSSNLCEDGSINACSIYADVSVYHIVYIYHALRVNLVSKTLNKRAGTHSPEALHPKRKIVKLVCFWDYEHWVKPSVTWWNNWIKCWGNTWWFLKEKHFDLHSFLNFIHMTLNILIWSTIKHCLFSWILTTFFSVSQCSF